MSTLLKYFSIFAIFETFHNLEKLGNSKPRVLLTSLVQFYFWKL